MTHKSIKNQVSVLTRGEHIFSHGQRCNAVFTCEVFQQTNTLFSIVFFIFPTFTSAYLISCSVPVNYRLYLSEQTVSNGEIFHITNPPFASVLIF